MGWPLVKISDLCEILDSRRKPITKKDRVEGPYPYYGATGVLSYVDDFLFDEELVLVGEDGAKWGAGDNSAFKIDGKTWVNNHAHVLKPFRQKILDQWLIYYLNGQDLSDFITGMTVPKLNQGKLKEIPVPLPPIPEQKRIVTILELAFADIDKARANAEQNLKNARELFESYLQQVFSQRGEGWVDCRMSDICEITSKLVDPKEDKYLDFYHVGAGNMVSMTGELVNVKTAREEGLISGKFVFDDSMVLYSKIRPYLMKVTRPDFMGLCSADVYPLSPIGNKVDKHYLFYLLLSKNFTNYAILGSGRAGMPKVNRTHLFNYLVKIPSIEKQREYVIKIDQIAGQSQMLERLYSSKLQELEELKKSILQKAFTGELTRADAAAENKGAAA